MKVSSINLLHNTNHNKNNKVSLNKNSAAISNSLINNSLSEAIGRSQVVQFKGKRYENNNGLYETKSKNLFKNEEINYNKLDGSQIINTINKVTKKVVERKENYPSKKIEIKYTLIDSGVLKRTKMPGYRITEKFDTNNIRTVARNPKELNLNHPKLDLSKYQTYCSIENIKERSIRSIRRDNDLQREIVTEEQKGNRNVYIIDTKTGKLIKSGEKILDKIYDEENNLHITKNILTGLITEKKRYRGLLDKKIDYLIRYYEGTKDPKFEVIYDKKEKTYTEKYFEASNRKPAKIIIRNEHKREDEIFQYNPEGTELLSHILTKHDSNGVILEEYVYNSKSGNLETETLYKKGYKIITYYSQDKKNIATHTDFCNHNGVYKHMEYQKDGMTCQNETVIYKNGDARYTKFDKSEKPEYIDYYDEYDNLYMSEDYYPGNKNIYIVTRYNVTDNGYSQFIYDLSSKNPKVVIRSDENGNVNMIAENYKHSSSPEFVNTYFNDGTFEINWRDIKKTKPKKKEQVKINTEQRDIYERHNNYKNNFRSNN